MSNNTASTTARGYLAGRQRSNANHVRVSDKNLGILG